MKTLYALTFVLGARFAVADVPNESPSVGPVPSTSPSASAAGSGLPVFVSPSLGPAAAPSASASAVVWPASPSAAQPATSASPVTAPFSGPGPDDVQISPHNPAAVNLAAVLAGLMISPEGLLLRNRSNGVPAAGSSIMTVRVQKKEDIKQTGEYQIDLKNATGVYCPLATDDYSRSWPCAFAEGLKQAGWDIGTPFDVALALQALSGYPASDRFNAARDDPKSLNEGSLWVLPDPKKSPWILGTKSSEVAFGVKSNYAYAMSLATAEDSRLYKSANPIKLQDPAIEDNNVLISFDELRQSASTIWGFSADPA